MADGIGPDEATVADVMTEGLATVNQSDDLQAALQAMRDNGVRRLGVTADGGALVGIVSFDDVVRALAGELGDLAGIIRTEREREAKVEQNDGLPLFAL
jgi:predicted transcriptional regulator